MNTNKCGSCSNFIKMKRLRGKGRGGLCNINDWVVSTDCVVKDCTQFKGIKYNRKKNQNKVDTNQES